MKTTRMSQDGAIRFDSRYECLSFIRVHRISDAVPSGCGSDWTAVIFMPDGVYGVASENEMVLLPEW